MLQHAIKVVGALWEAILHGPNRMVQTYLYQQIPEFSKNKSNHPTPPGLVGRMDLPGQTKVSRKITPHLQELVDKGGGQLRGFSFRILSPD